MAKPNRKARVRSASEQESGILCTLCQREVSAVSRHHMIPRSEGGTDTVDLCAACHATLHRFFSNRTLTTTYNSIEALRAEPVIQRYLKWVCKQPDRHIRVRARKDRM